MQPALEQRALDLKIADRVIFTGSRSDIPNQLAAMDLFVLPTLREGFGVVFAEAMAMGKVVVGSDIGPVREVVTDGETASQPWLATVLKSIAPRISSTMNARDGELKENRM